MKRLLKWGLRTTGLVLLVIFLVLGGAFLFVPISPDQTLLWPQGLQPTALYDPGAFGAPQQDSLLARFGHNKVLPQGYEVQALLALSHYPELKDAHIHFFRLPASYPLASRPEYLTLLGPQTKRQYNIFLSTDTGIPFLNQINLDALPFNAQVAILAHELGHAVYYERQSVWGMLKFPLRFFTDLDFRAAHESTTDKLVIYRGLGLHLLAYTEYTRQILRPDGPIAPPEGFVEQMGWVEKLYLDSGEVRAVMAEIPAYSPFLTQGN